MRLHYVRAVRLPVDERTVADIGVCPTLRYGCAQTLTWLGWAQPQAGLDRFASAATNEEVHNDVPIRQAFLALLVGLVPFGAAAQNSTQVGALSGCDVSAGSGLFRGPEAEKLSCVFTQDSAGGAENYVGSIDQFGVELGGVEAGHLIWASSRRRKAFRRALLPASMPELAQTRRLASVRAPTCLSAAVTGHSPCSPSRSRGSLASTSPAASPR